MGVNVLYGIYHYTTLWIAFFASEKDFQQVQYYVWRVWQSLCSHASKMVDGDYQRLVAAAYVIQEVSKPGESLVAKLIRIKMSFLNQEFIDGIDKWHEWCYNRFTNTRRTSVITSP